MWGILPLFMLLFSVSAIAALEGVRHKVKAPLLEVRSIPTSSGEVLDLIPGESVVLVYHSEGGWSLISDPQLEQRRWVKSSALVPFTGLAPKGEAISRLQRYRVLPATLNTRSKPSTSGVVMRKLGEGEEVAIYSEVDGWGRITAIDSSPAEWVSLGFLQPLEEETTVAEATVADQTPASAPAERSATTLPRYRIEPVVLNVRNRPSSGGRLIGQLRQGSEVTAYSEREGWIRITAPNEGDEGWVSKRFVEELAPTAAATAAETVVATAEKEIPPSQPLPTAKPPTLRRYQTEPVILNVRSQPSVEGRLVERLPQGSEVLAYGEREGWIRISPDTASGEQWLSLRFVTELPPLESQPPVMVETPVAPAPSPEIASGDGRQEVVESSPQAEASTTAPPPSLPEVEMPEITPPSLSPPTEREVAIYDPDLLPPSPTAENPTTAPVTPQTVVIEKEVVGGGYYWGAGILLLLIIALMAVSLLLLLRRKMEVEPSLYSAAHLQREEAIAAATVAPTPAAPFTESEQLHQLRQTEKELEAEITAQRHELQQERERRLKELDEDLAARRQQVDQEVSELFMTKQNKISKEIKRLEQELQQLREKRDGLASEVSMDNLEDENGELNISEISPEILQMDVHKLAMQKHRLHTYISSQQKLFKERQAKAQKELEALVQHKRKKSLDEIAQWVESKKQEFWIKLKQEHQGGVRKLEREVEELKRRRDALIKEVEL
ncbi:MAG: SH3 domain-containing protein [Gammaproteobacteria bacterium]|nr:SH3 domain-containing protein [Gammaproteobacteria bacterium]